jgi:putative Holliday junction resolvase
MGRIAAIDFGMARIGIALSDERKVIALPSCVMPAQKSMEESVKAICEKLSTFGAIDSIIVGLPLLLSGKESPMSQIARKFAELLEKLSGIRTILFDERLTSAQADRALKDHMSRKKRSKVIDAVAASTLLQCFLDAHPIRVV